MKKWGFKPNMHKTDLQRRGYKHKSAKNPSGLSANNTVQYNDDMKNNEDENIT